MTAFFGTQLDFILFFYGLAFLLLSVICYAMTWVSGRRDFSATLGTFALLHGIGEWLDLLALLIGDTQTFALARTALMTVSFALLLEFGRLQALRFLGERVAGRWIHIPLILLVGIGFAVGGLPLANALARYLLGFTGALATAWAFARIAANMSPTRKRILHWAAAVVALYGVCAGAIVPNAPAWPARFVNYESFTGLTGLPIQLVRGVLALTLTMLIWFLWKRMLATEIGSERYVKYMRRMTGTSVVVVCALLGLGWGVTQVFGERYELRIERASQSGLALIAGNVDRETALVDSVARTLAGAGQIPTKSSLEAARLASGADFALALDAQGKVLRATGIGAITGARNPCAGLVEDSAEDSVASSPRDAGGQTRFAIDPNTGERMICARYALARNTKATQAQVQIGKSLRTLAKDLAQFNHLYFLIDRDGTVMLSNQSGAAGRLLWPGRHAGDAYWTSLDGQRQFIRVENLTHGPWLLITASPAAVIIATRFSGIAVTLLAFLMLMTYLAGRERSLRERIESERFLKLQDVARDLRAQATTDPLTGIHNRLRFDEALAVEMARANRHQSALSLVLCDVDHFKKINDTYGHPCGDKVLIELSELMSGGIRLPDLFARWGGEEFALLSPGSDERAAVRAAERLRSTIEKATFAQVGAVRCSFGVAQYRPGDGAQDLIARADAALYRAKIEGRNRVVSALSLEKSKTELTRTETSRDS